MNARDAILGRIRSGLAASARAHSPAPKPAPLPAIDDPISRFRTRAEALSSTVVGPLAPGDAATAVADYLRTHGLPRAAVVWPEMRAFDWHAAGIEIDARPALRSDLIGITGAFCAIAETGTLMLVSGAETPASVSLLPETHIALVPVARVLAHMEDAWVLLRAHHPAPPRAVNFISGPSRTADIEQTVTLGAHGPYRVLIVLLADR